MTPEESLRDRRERLSPEKRALLEKRIRTVLSQERAATPIPRLTDRSAIPLSFGQERLWFLQQFEPGSVVYNRPCLFRLAGPLDVPVLEQSLNEIVRRHETLRTRFCVDGDRRRQEVMPPRDFALPVVDLAGLPLAARQKEAERLAREEVGQPFDLEHGPLWRCRLVRLDAQEHWLVLTLHHIVFDGWSQGVLEGELTVLYDAFSAGQPSPLTELPVQYADFAAWQRDWLKGDVLNRQLAYWKERLAGAPPFLELPTDFPRPAVQDFRGARQELVLEQSLTQALNELSRQEGVTLFMTLLAAWQVLLSRYSGQTDVVVGAPIAGRSHSELEGLIGFFVNTLALRTDLSGDPTFRDVLERVREVTLDAYAHQDLPFESLVTELNPPRRLDRNPLCDVLLNYVSTPAVTARLPGLECQTFDLDEPESKFLMTLYVRHQDTLHLQLVCRRSLFSNEWMRILLKQFQYLLEQIVAEPGRSIDSYSLVAPESAAWLPDPAQEMAEPCFPPVTETVLEWAGRTPNQIAVNQGSRDWTYAAVCQFSENLARQLIACGIKKGDAVAIHGPRSLGTIVALLGTLRCGGVLVPIDEDLPRRRKELMLHEAAPRALIFVGPPPADDDWCRGRGDLARFEVDPLVAGVTGDSEQSPGRADGALPQLLPDDPAYLFFTSGTTGIPKGILGCHKGLAHFLHWQRTEFAIGPDDRVAQLTSLSFDVVLRDILLPLTSGGTVCLPESTTTADNGRIFAWLQRQKITLLHAVPSLAEFWLEQAPANLALPALRHVFFAGEPLTDKLVGRWRQIVSKTSAVVNLYGPTETTLAKCFYRVPAHPLPGVQPIGRPLPQTQALILAGHNRLCGVGERGEIVLRTPFRTRGYLKPAERNGFVKNPFREDDADALYLTGDRGRYRPDGTLEILGRLDDQVKIHGVRIEPAEIASILNTHPGVRNSFVLPLVGESTALAVYVVPKERSGVSIDALRSYLGQRFPMTVASFVFTQLDQLPLTPNGKVDRRALPIPEVIPLEQQAPSVAPRTPVEEQLARIWGDVLGRERIGINHNFFDVGGHSLLATRLVSKIREAFRVELPLRTIFELPTIEGLALRILEQVAKAARPERIGELLANLDSISDDSAARRFQTFAEPPAPTSPPVPGPS